MRSTKAEFYSAACLVRGMPIPQFIPATEPARNINAALSQRDTGFSYLFSDQASLLR
jgi:hypothetical protein